MLSFQIFVLKVKNNSNLNRNQINFRSFQIHNIVIIIFSISAKKRSKVLKVITHTYRFK